VGTTISPSERARSSACVVGEQIRSLPDHELAGLEAALGRTIGALQRTPGAVRVLGAVVGLARREARIRAELGGPRWQ
jgi:hypothetical protein